MTQIDNIENQEKYLINSPGTIKQKLKQLAKNHAQLTINFANGESFLTSVVDVLSVKNLLILDYGPNESQNEKLIETDRAVLQAKPDGITTQFTIQHIQRARIQGTLSFACPIPETLLWVQRREFYRVKVPLSETVFIEHENEAGKKLRYTVIDISVGGVAIKDFNAALEPGDILHNCKLVLGDQAEGIVDLEIRDEIPLDKDNGKRCGCMFLNLPGELEIEVQRFINYVDIQQKRIAD